MWSCTCTVVDSKTAGWGVGRSTDLISNRNPATLHPVTVGETLFRGEPCRLLCNRDKDIPIPFGCCEQRRKEDRTWCRRGAQ